MPNNRFRIWPKKFWKEQTMWLLKQWKWKILSRTTTQPSKPLLLRLLLKELNMLKRTGIRSIQPQCTSQRRLSKSLDRFISMPKRLFLHTQRFVILSTYIITTYLKLCPYGCLIKNADSLVNKNIWRGLFCM